MLALKLVRKQTNLKYYNRTNRDDQHTDKNPKDFASKKTQAGVVTTHFRLGY